MQCGDLGPAELGICPDAAFPCPVQTCWVRTRPQTRPPDEQLTHAAKDWCISFSSLLCGQDTNKKQLLEKGFILHCYTVETGLKQTFCFKQLSVSMPTRRRAFGENQNCIKSVLTAVSVTASHHFRPFLGTLVKVLRSWLCEIVWWKVPTLRTSAWSSEQLFSKCLMLKNHAAVSKMHSHYRR